MQFPIPLESNHTIHLHQCIYIYVLIFPCHLISLTFHYMSPVVYIAVPVGIAAIILLVLVVVILLGCYIYKKKHMSGTLNVL